MTGSGSPKERRRGAAIPARIILASVMLGVSSSALAAEDPEPASGRTINILVYGDDPCPKSTDEEIVVCARRPEKERYRIPKQLREREDRSETSWASRNEDLDEASRPSRPGSCSVVGSYGQSGCFQQMLNQWFRERRASRPTRR